MIAKLETELGINTNPRFSFDDIPNAAFLRKKYLTGQPFTVSSGGGRWNISFEDPSLHPSAEPMTWMVISLKEPNLTQIDPIILGMDRSLEMCVGIRIITESGLSSFRTPPFPLQRSHTPSVA